MKNISQRVLQFGFIYACGVLAASSQGATIYQYAFAQGGYSGASGGFTLTGQFSGSPDANGVIALSSLTSFSLLGLNSMPDLFSFNVNGGGSTLDLTFRYSTDPFTGQVACVGGPALSGGIVGTVNCAGGSFNGVYYTFSPVNVVVTRELPQMTLLSIVTDPSPAAAPEPGTATLFALAFLLVAVRLISPIRNKTLPPPVILSGLAHRHSYRSLRS
jgi:hypothetical protein